MVVLRTFRGGAPSEGDGQRALFEWARASEGRYPELALLHAVPNGGLRHIATAARMKAEGAKAGVPDICLPVARGPWHGLYVEMKTATGRLSEAQKRWLSALAKEGYRAEVARGFDEARELILDYLRWGAVKC